MRHIEVPAVLDQHRKQVLLTEHEDAVEALAAYAAEKGLADGIRARSPDGRLEDLRASATGHAIELLAVLVIAIPDDEARSDAEGRRVAHLLRGPRGAGLAGDSDVDDPARAEVDDEECEDRPEPMSSALYVDGFAKPIPCRSQRDLAPSLEPPVVAPGTWLLRQPHVADHAQMASASRADLQPARSSCST